MHFGRKTGRPINCFQCIQHGEGSGLPCHRWLKANHRPNILLRITIWINSIENSTIITTSWRARKALSRFGIGGKYLHERISGLPAPCLECWNPAGCRIFDNSVAARFLQCQSAIYQRTHRGHHFGCHALQSGQELFARMQDRPKYGKTFCTVECSSVLYEAR